MKIHFVCLTAGVLLLSFNAALAVFMPKKTFSYEETLKCLSKRGYHA